MQSVTFLAYGHENVIGNHKTTLELTSERFLTSQGTCIIGIRAEMTPFILPDHVKALIRSTDSEICLTMRVDELEEVISGHGSPGLTCTDGVSMVVRTSLFECGRTLMVEADKAANDIGRDFIKRVQNPAKVIHCEISCVTL